MDPAGLLLGVATADHQCEAFEARWEDVRDRWERDRRLTPRGRATDFWARYGEDVELARGLGCTAFRISVAWARVEPSPGVFDVAVLGHYREVVDAIAAAGMEPVVTLVHNTWPLHVEEDRGGLAGDAFAERVGAYTGVVARALAPRVRWWLTLNEPNQLVYGYLKAWWQGEYRMPPGLPAGVTTADQLRHVRQAMRSLFLANARARAAIRAVRPDAMVGTNPFLLGVPDWLQRLLDRRATGLRTEGAWDGCIARRARRRPWPGSVDLVAAALSATPDRGGAADFSRPYHVAAMRLLVPAASAVRSAADVGGGPVAVVAGSTAEAAAPELLPGASVLRGPDLDAALAALRSGAAAALLGDDAVLEGVAARGAGAWAVVGGPLRPERHVIGVANGDAGLLAVVDAAIAGVPEGPSPEPAHGALARARRRGRLVAGVRADLPGLGYRDPDTGEWSGREVELVREVAARALGDPDRLELVPVTTAGRLDALRPPLCRVLDPVMRWVDLFLCALDSEWWFLGMLGRLPEWLCPRGCEGQQDFAGVDYYWGIRDLSLHRLRQLGDAAAGNFAGAPVWPAAMGRVLRRTARMFPGQPVLVVENGCVARAGDLDRSAYLRIHVREALRARAGGVPLAAYLCWSVTSNREWGLPFAPSNDFGLYHVELDADPELRRVPTAAAEVYRELVREAP